MSNAKTLSFAAVVGGCLGVLANQWWSAGDTNPRATDTDQQDPLYWVAPMDSNYRRDEPGKSPMGMDLVPVYAEPARQNPPGTVRISPTVSNNLGVRTAIVMPGRLPNHINTVGYLQFDEDRLLHIHPRVAGWIETLSVKASGDPVQQGEPLYTLYSPTLVNAQEELLAAVSRDNPALIAAAADRLSALQVPDTAIERLRNRGELSHSITVSAPQSGVVDKLQAREGMYVEPGMEVLSIGALDSIWAILEVFERQAEQVQTGDIVQLSVDALPGKHWQGQVDYIYPTLNPLTRTLRLRVRVANPDAALRPGMFAQAQITTQPGEQRLLVPREALIRTGTGNRVVMALGDGEFRSAAVTVGRVGTEQAEILEGLSEGDRIVTSAQFLIDSESSTTAGLSRLEAPARTEPDAEDEQDQGAMLHTDHHAPGPSHTALPSALREPGR